MSAEVWAILGVGIALGGLMWRMLRSIRQDMDRRFVSNRWRSASERCGASLPGLADDHSGLARELSELRGEIRGRLDERARPASAD